MGLAGMGPRIHRTLAAIAVCIVGAAACSSPSGSPDTKGSLDVAGEETPAARPQECSTEWHFPTLRQDCSVEGEQQGYFGLLQIREFDPDSDGLTTPLDFAVSPGGETLYVASDGGLFGIALDGCGLVKEDAQPQKAKSLHEDDPFHQVLVAPSGGSLAALGYEWAGMDQHTLYLFSRDEVSGELSLLEASTTSLRVTGAAWSADSTRLYLAGYNPDNETPGPKYNPTVLVVYGVVSEGGTDSDTSWNMINYCQAFQGQEWTNYFCAHALGLALGPGETPVVWLAMNELLVKYEQAADGSYSPADLPVPPNHLDPSPPKGTVLVDYDGKLGLACAKSLYASPDGKLLYTIRYSGCPLYSTDLDMDYVEDLEAMVGVYAIGHASTHTPRQNLPLYPLVCGGKSEVQCENKYEFHGGAGFGPSMVIDHQRHRALLIAASWSDVVRIRLDPDTGEFLPESVDTAPFPDLGYGPYGIRGLTLATATGRTYGWAVDWDEEKDYGWLLLVY